MNADKLHDYETEALIAFERQWEHRQKVQAQANFWRWLILTLVVSICVVLFVWANSADDTLLWALAFAWAAGTAYMLAKLVFKGDL